MTDTSTRPTLIVFSGGMRESPVERLVAGARDAAALDTLTRGVQSGAFAGVILATDSADLGSRVPPGVDVDLDDGRFDFAFRLRDLVRRRKIQRPFYVGGGSIPLLDTADLTALADRLTAAEELVISNNFYSADFVGWTLEKRSTSCRRYRRTIACRSFFNLRPACPIGTWSGRWAPSSISTLRQT